MTDFEPASALANRILESVDTAEAASIVRKDRAAIREPLERRIAELEGKVRWFVEKAADEKLDGYRELGQRAAEAENRRDDAMGHIASLETRLEAANAICRALLKGLDEAHERIASLEAQLEKTAVDAVETIADLKHTISMHEERIDREQNRIASLEAQLSKREPVQEEGDSHDPNGTGECFVDGWTGRRCRVCTRWVWGGPMACAQCASLEAQLASAREERDRLIAAARPVLAQAESALDAFRDELDDPEEEPGMREDLETLRALLPPPAAQKEPL